MDWLLVVLLALVAAVVSRLYVAVRRVRRDQSSTWDAKVIERLRAQGSDPFQPHDVDFFFALPSEAACRAVGAQLEAEGFAVDIKPLGPDAEHPFSLHASKRLRLSAPEMSELSRRFSQLAGANGGRYDGWTAAAAAK